MYSTRQKQAKKYFLRQKSPATSCHEHKRRGRQGENRKAILYLQLHKNGLHFLAATKCIKRHITVNHGIRQIKTNATSLENNYNFPEKLAPETLTAKQETKQESDHYLRTLNR